MVKQKPGEIKMNFYAQGYKDFCYKTCYNVPAGASYYDESDYRDGWNDAALQQYYDSMEIQE